MATARRDPEALSTAGEARALFLLTGPSAGAVPEARSALRKLLRALPSTFRGEAEAVADAVVIDPAGWGRTGREELPDMVRQLQQAVVRRRRIMLRYQVRDELGALGAALVDRYGQL